MNKFEPYAIKHEDFLELKEMSSLGERVQWIREKANEKNPTLFTRYRVADKSSLSQSTIKRIEENEVASPQRKKLEDIAAYLRVPVEAFFDDYYKGEPKSFIICEPEDEIIKEIDLESVSYVVELSAITKSIMAKTNEVTFEDKVELTALDYEEFIDDLTTLVEKVKKRRQTWELKRNAYNRLKGVKEEDD
ncbi:helix-turn-helix domain-containing protein [Oceanobacillus picturae]|uniref:helix-turn-helix domain-containing protein n=1 Tax=Oceanobacillus picturae TaxID=171693 RepID=UPI000E6A3DC5|nr:helix-turn-helix transcriptional regulator [Oceanobacillus picturae]RIU93425.1 XRE family transcriptional regulator [Oceanobacillus picturae]